MKIPNLINQFTKQIICVLCVFLTLSFALIKFLMWMTGSNVVGIAAILLIIYGTFALYPGCIRYIKSDYQMRGSQRIIEAIIKNLQQFYGLIFRCQQHADTAYLSTIYFHNHVKQTITMMAKFQKFISIKKKSLLLAYRKIDAIMSSEYKIQDITFTYEQFIQSPNLIRERLYNKFKNNNQLKQFAQDFGRKITVYTKQINNILNQLNPSQQVQRDTLKMFLYRVYSQKLYQIRFGYMYWNPRYQYSIYLVKSKDDRAMIQCAIIHGQKDKPLKQNKCVIISLPNGAYLQYFALESQYIQMYLNMGYQIILWNYRGYGQSSGEPTISNSIQDAQSVYNYCQKNLKLDLQISHGYSIGGPPAAYLAYKNPFKVLIIDRSFCNFVNIAHQISPFLGKLARFIMRADANVNISEVYLKIKNCKKILIWSSVDEVISNGSSLKLGILSKIAQQHSNIGFKNSQNVISQVQLSQKQSFIQKRNFSKSNKLKVNTQKLQVWYEKLQKFFKIIRSLHQAQKLQQNAQIILNTSQQRLNNIQLIEEVTQQLKSYNPKSQQSQRNQKIKQIMNQFWQIVGRIDGGGTQIKFLHDLAIGGQNNSFQLHIQIKSFVLGLLHYGSCYHDNENLDIQNISNRELTVNTLKKVDDKLQIFIKENQSLCPKKLMEYIKFFHSVLNQMKKYLQQIGIRDNGLGIVLPTNSGHNGQLTQNQLLYLKVAIGYTKINVIQQKISQTQIDIF